MLAPLCLLCSDAYRLSSNLSRWYHVHRNFDEMLAAAGDDSIDWCNVAIIPAPANRDMACARERVVRRIKIDPAKGRGPDGKPGMARICAEQPFLAGRRLGQQVAADISRRQT